MESMGNLKNQNTPSLWLGHFLSPEKTGMNQIHMIKALVTLVYEKMQIN